MDAVQFTNVVVQRNSLVARCESVIVKPSFIRSKRDEAALRYLMLIFEHHRGIVMLAPDCRSPAFSLMRPITEAFNRLHVTMHGTDKQFQALLNDDYRTEYKTEGQLVDEVCGFEPILGPLFGEIKVLLHSFAHAGNEHLSRMIGERGIGPNYSNEDTADLLHYATLLVLLAGLTTMHFLERTDDEVSCKKLLDEFLGVGA